MARRVMGLCLLAAALLASCGGEDEGTNGATTRASDGQKSAGPPESDIYFGALDVRPANQPAGLFVRRFERDSPVATGGIQHADVITAVDGDRVRSVSDMVDALNSLPGDHDAADVVQVEVMRGSKKRTLEVTLAANVYLGAAVKDAPRGERGVLVVSVKGPAADAGIRHGDLITAIDRKPVADVNELFATLGTYQAGDEIVVAISRGSGERRVSVILAPRPHLG